MPDTSKILHPDEIKGPVLDEKIKKLMEFFDTYGIDYGKFKPEFIDFLAGKRAYPNYDQYMYIPGQHDIKKWLMAVKDIHYKKRAGYHFKDAVRQATQNWKKMEIYDFLNWLRFHEEGTHMKYKTAQVWYENGQPGYFLHIKPDAQPEPEPVTDSNPVEDARQEAERNEEKRNIIEKQRAKIIGRLDSAEKLLRSPEGQQFAGTELEQLMEAVYTLKKKVQLVNKLSVSTRLYEDMIIREANVLTRKGLTKAASVLYSIAQSPGQAGESATGQAQGGKVPMDVPPPPDPSGAGQSGTMVGLPATTPGTEVNTPVDGAAQTESQPPAAAIMGGGNAPSGTAESSPTLIPQEAPQPKGISEFIENMNEGNKTDETKASDDELEVRDEEEELMVTEAQLAPPPGIPPAVLEDVPLTDEPTPVRGQPAKLPAPRDPIADAAPPAPKMDKAEEPLEVTEDDIPPVGGDTPSGGGNASDLDSKLDKTFDSVTMEEIVAELEDVSKYYKVREMPRRLARLDMMFDSKGISAYFPSLAEAQNKALEGNNYISTRIDDILSKVRGSLASEDMGAKLKQDEDKEKQRKQIRKDQEATELVGGQKENPQVEMGELGAPAPVPPVARPLG